jgi:UDP-glucose-4-epimerase GalE
MRIVVIGGAGYIGSHTARELARRRHEVIIYDDLSTGHAFLADGFELVIGKIGDRERLLSVFSGAGAVMHFAACASVAESVRNPGKYFKNNISDGVCLLQAVQQARIPYFIFSSSCTVYGLPKTIPINEDTPCDPVNPYGISKLFFERALAAYEQAHGLRYAALRYFNAAGADESGEIGEVHDPETHLIPLALQAAAGLRSGLAIYGDDYSTRDGTCVRDYIHVSDIAEAHVRALDYLCAEKQSATLNLGTGKGYTVNEVVAEVEFVTERVCPTTYHSRRPGDVAELVADPTRAQTLLGWSPSRSLHQIISSAWMWFQHHQMTRQKREKRIGATVSV